MNLTAALSIALSTLEALAPTSGPLQVALTHAAPTPVVALLATPDAEAGDASTQVALGQWRTIVSPWGFCDTYFVFHGYNTLICSGTGRCFTYYHCGFAVEGGGEAAPVPDALLVR